MHVFALSDEIEFPDPHRASAEGLLAIGGDLSLERLVAAYANGIFPWYDDDTPILWWSPDPRCVLYPSKLHIPASLRRRINSGCFTVSLDTAFESVIAACATSPRPGQQGTWIVDEMIDAYVSLHEAGIAHSLEVWSFDDKGRRELAGGLYGVSLGGVFYGESMFFHQPDASKVGMVWLVSLLKRWGFHIIDCQQTTDHLMRFGAEELPRAAFLQELTIALRMPLRAGKWTFPEGFWPL
ncbi:leucyl/phenylalanyl-tRNA--protein transferase [Oleidesulfovibrio sp.]|uniref:leucyl/phenylalanyl-tRNA--protein transferase n=1 Tax=Oleidesulfovibrio sp. TaxID=2909707 RepID=UPI003A83CD08